MKLEAGDMVPQEEHSNSLSSAKWSVLKIYIRKTFYEYSKLYLEICVYICICIKVYIQIHICMQ